MDGSNAFKLPSNVPQDLQLIQDLIGDLVPLLSASKPVASITSQNKAEDDIEGSDSDADSEKEVEADILAGLDDEVEGASGYVWLVQVSVC